MLQHLQRACLALSFFTALSLSGWAQPPSYDGDLVDIVYANDAFCEEVFWDETCDCEYNALADGADPSEINWGNIECIDAPADPCEDELAFDADLTSYSVECISDLPEACDETVGANRGDVACTLGSARFATTTCTGTTALGTGEDGAIVLFDIDGDPHDDRYFVPTDGGITLTQFENGVAHITGQVADTDNPNAILDVNIVYNDGVSGADWDGGFKHDQSCPVTTDITDDWTIYIMNDGMSYLLGSGDLEGTLLTLSHAPASEYFGFQIGEMANDRNCNYGAGGWFSYQGVLNGVEIQGAQGDVLLDLDCATDDVDLCGENESSVTLIYTVIDTDCGDALTTEQVVSRDDTTDPTFDNEPANETVACADGLPAVPTVTASDNCEADDGEPTVTYTGQSDPYDVECTGSYKVDRTWTAEDCSGNMIGYTQTITVIDEVAPVISGGEALTVECDGAGNADDLAGFLSSNGGATATDDCGTVTWSHDYADGDLSDDCGATGTVDVTFTASDDCGNASTITLTFTIEDTEAPTLTASPMVEVDCALYDPTAIYEATASDVCGDATVVLVSVTELSSCAGSFTHNYMAVDDCGNESAIYGQVVNLIDTVAPVLTITCPADADLEADADCNADTSVATNGTATYTATDNCDDALDNELTHSDATVDGCEGSYTITRTWTLTSTDHCGNTSTTSCDQIITVSDETAPTIDVAAADETVECDGAGNSAELNAWLAANGGAEASDNCSSELTWTNDFTALSDDCGATGSATVTFTATDDCGNSSSSTATFTIEDTTPPSIDTEASDETVECDGAGNIDALNAWLASHGGAAASDICGDATWSNDFEGLSDDCGATGSATVTFTATDDCGNTSSTEATFTIEDTTAPTWDSYDVYTTAACEDLLDPTDPTLVPISASDICGGVSYSIQAYQLSGGCPGTWMRVWTATDDCGNDSDPTEQYVQLYDIIDPVPVITCPADYTVDADADCNADVSPAAAGTATATATDNCDSDVAIEITYEDGETTSLCEGQYSFIRTWTASAEDDCDNTADVSCDQLITVEDNTNPSIDVEAADLTVECDGAGNGADLSAWLADNGGAEASDNCSAITWTHSDATLSDLCAATGAVTVTFTATDDCGNSSSSTATFTIEDTTAPAFSGDFETTISCDEWTCDADALEALGVFSIDEACGDYTLDASCTSFSGGCVTPVGAYQVDYTAEDECGNTSSFTQIVILSDDVKPVPSIVCPADIALTADADCNADLSTDNTGMATGSATDNCDAAPEVVVTYTDGPTTAICAGSYSFIRTFTATATDHCENEDSISCDQVITVNDETAPDAPVISGPADAEVFLDADCATDATPAITGEASATADDNCDADPSIDITYSDSEPTYTCTGDDAAEGSYTFVRTWTAVATDDCDNEGAASTYAQTITVTDNLAPDFGESSHTFTIACDEYDEDEPYAVAATDNCDSDVTITILSNAQVSSGCAGGFLRTYQAEDDCGNTTNFEQAITLLDTVAPVVTISCPSDANLTADESCGADTSTDALGTATFTAEDNCDADLDTELTYSDSEADYTCSGSYSFTRTWTISATDHCDSTSTASCDQLITVTDDTAPADPTLDCADDIELFLDADCNADLSTDNTGMTLPSSSDNCDSDPSIDLDYSDAAAVYTCTGDDDNLEGSYTILRTWSASATDDCGNASGTTTCDQLITVTDNTAPGFDGSSDTYDIACDAYDADTQYAVMAADNCDSEVTITILSNTDTEGSCAGSILRVYQAVDDCGNTSTFEQTINLLDDVDPTVSITCPADADLEADAACMADVSVETLGDASYTAADNCDSDLNVVLTHEDVTTEGCEGSYTIARTFTVTVTDHCGNSASDACTQTITVSDVTAPSIDTEAMDLTVECDGLGNVFDYLTWQTAQGGAMASDNCADVTWSHSVLETGDDCGGTVGYSIVEFTASDDCGNTSTTTATFTIEDTTPPAITADDVVDVPCDEYDANTAYGNYSATDICGSASTEISDVYFSGACEGTYTRTYTATDDCGNASTFMQIINLTDEEAPTFTITCPDDVTLSADGDCNADTSAETNGMAAASDVLDNCDTDVEVNVSYADATDYPCAGSMVITRTFTITAEDNCDNVTTLTCDQTITVNDDTDPSLTAPEDVTVECDGAGNADALAAFLAGATASDNCDGDVSITHDFDALSDGCGATGSATVTFTATDACGNSTSASATFTIEDTTPPSLSIEGPANQDLEQNATCDLDTSVDALGTVNATASDDCGDATIAITHEDGLATYTCSGDDDTLEGSYTFDRTFTVTATDDCGLTTSDTYVQTITVSDVTAPQFSNTCDLENGDALSVCCESHLGDLNIPDACEPEYMDNCDSDVAYAYTETYVGAYAPTADVDLFCLSTTPAAFEDGETCNGYDPHSLRIFALPGGAEFYTAAGPGLVSNNSDGTLTITQSVLAADGSTAGWDIAVTFGAALGWDDWSNQAFPTGYKRDCGDLIDDHLNWEYRILESGTLTGTGDYAGSEVSLSHAPSNNYYATQFGLGANNMNNEYGYSGWFTYSGTFMEQDVMGSGDLFGDLDCCLPWSIERDYSIADDCGNTTGFGYTLEINGDDCADDADSPAVSGGTTADHSPTVIGGAGNVVTGKTPIRVTNLQPNPTNDISQLGFVVSEDMRIRVDLVGMDGVLVAELFDGIAQDGVNHTLDIEAGSLSNGMYQIRLSSSAYLVVKKLLVSE